MSKLYKIPLSQIPNQKFRVILGGQNCTIHLYLKGKRLYMDLFVDSTTIMTGAPCLIGINLVQYKHINFAGCLFFIDKTGCAADPVYTEFNTRFALFYVPEGVG